MKRITLFSKTSKFFRKRRLSTSFSSFPRTPVTFTNTTSRVWSQNSFGNGRFSFLLFSSQAEENSTDPAVRTSFRNQLNNYYHANHNVSIRDSFHTDNIGSEGMPPTILWTSTFECPVTGDRIASGELQGEEYRIQKDGRWYYSSKKTSIQAAAMQALNQLDTDSTKEDKKYRSLSVSKKQTLLTWYKRTHNIDVTDSMFDARKRSMVGKKNGGIWWTASFTCPVYGQQFKALELQSGETFFRDSTGYWYRKKSDAIDAAAAHAIYINKLEGGSEKGSERDSRKLEESHGDDVDSMLGEPSNEKTTGSPSLLTRAPLTAYYHKTHDVSISNEDFVASLASFKGKKIGGNWWTATFICPVTGGRYDSKRLLGSNWHEDSDGIIWYKKREDSILAAGLGALDAMKFKDTGVVEPRYCKDDPSEVALEETTMLLPDLITNKEDAAVANDIPTSLSSTDENTGTQEEDEEFSIELVPQRLGSTGELEPATATTTFDLIADTWLESSNQQNAANPASFIFHNPLSERQEAIKRAKYWVELQQDDAGDDEGNRTCFNSQGQTANTKIANLILDSLARAKRGPSLDNEVSGIEAAATAVLENMWSSHSTIPNADSYASFIRCLEGGSPSDISERARRIYDAMSNGTTFGGRILPSPNIEVYNSLIQLQAEAGIKTPVYDTDSRLEPNKGTFLSILSSMAAAPDQRRAVTGFDADKALLCIDQMKSLSEEYSQPSLLPDRQVYNAPLGWIGGIPAKYSRPYASFIPWDSYENIFQKGFKVLLKDHPLIQEASSIESWYESMKTGKFGPDISPDIETVESSIQAWVRTGTRDGLEKAESLAESLLDDNSGNYQVRLQTFHPILAAWGYCGAVDGPTKVDYWVKRLDGTGLPVMGDGRYRVAPIVARLSRQRQLQREYDVHELASPNSTDFHSLAVETSDHLEQIVQGFESIDDFFLEADTFKLAIQAWYNAGLSCARMGDVNGASEALSSIQDVVCLFDNIIQRLYNSLDEGPQSQLLHLLKASPEVYSAGFSAVNEFDQIQDARVSESLNGFHLLNHLNSLERSIRQSEEFRLCTEETSARARSVLPEQPRGSTGAERVYSDLFSFSTESFIQDSVSVTWLGFYIDIVQAIESSSIAPEKYHDFARIAVLIGDVLRPYGGENVTILNEHIINILRKFQLGSGGENELMTAVQTAYGPSQARQERSPYSAKNKSTKDSPVSRGKHHSNSSSNRRLRRPRDVQNRTTEGGSEPQPDTVPRKQQAC
eukprot:scaffold880_cov132-Cylindrotheca_fusiformis.AAC.74